VFKFVYYDLLKFYNSLYIRTLLRLGMDVFLLIEWLGAGEATKDCVYLEQLAYVVVVVNVCIVNFVVYWILYF